MSKPFIWTPKLTKKLFELRFQNDWLFKKKRQPWYEFYAILQKNGFPEEMTINHVRKKWSYTYDSFKIAKRTKNKSWKYYKMFDKCFGKSQMLDKYDTWSNDWRLKFISCVTDAKALKLDMQGMWKQIEKSLRCLDLPNECCIQDIKGLWHHIRMTFNRKYRLLLRRGGETEWPLYDVMLNYCQLYDKELLIKGASQTPLLARIKKNKTKKNNTDSKEEEETEFQWTKDITESFIQIRLQNDWLFRERKNAWNDLVRLMIEEYGFPNNLTNRDVCRKWNATFSDYQKALATNNTSWLYYNLFECYLGEGSFSFNPMLGWKEECVFSLINARTELEHLFSEGDSMDHQKYGWREVEKMLRSGGLPIDHSLLDLPEIWTHLLKTYRWKKKFSDKGMLTEHWPFFDAMTKYIEVAKSLELPTSKLKVKKMKYLEPEAEGYAEAADDDDDDLQLDQLRARLRPKSEALCRACGRDAALHPLFDHGEDGLPLAHKITLIAGVQIEISDNLPKQICFNCLKELENAYSFRRKCIDADRELRAAVQPPPEPAVKLEVKADEPPPYDYDAPFDDDCPSDDLFKTEIKPLIKKEAKRIVKKKRKLKKDRGRYCKMCEICGKKTSNLAGHLDAHSAGKAYGCDVCGKRFKYKSGLHVHKAVHDPTPKKTCEVCGKTFHIVAQYRRHFTYHANERAHHCDTCGKRFNSADILRVHRRMHTDERPFACALCGKTFRTAGCVSRHTRIVHRKAAKATAPPYAAQ